MLKFSIFGKKDDEMKSRVIAWLFREKKKEAQKADKTGNDDETEAAADHSIATTDVTENIEAVADENGTEEKLDNVVFGEMELYNAVPTTEEPTVADSRYNEQGLDCAGFSREYYQKRITVLLDRTCRAGRQMQDGNYEYSMFDLRYSLGTGLKMLLRHKGLETGTLEENIERCRMNCLITDKMAGGLHGVRKIGNCNEHSEYAQDNLTFNKVYFSIMETLEFLSVVEIWLLWPEPLPEMSAAWAREPITLESVIKEEKEKKENEEK